MGCKEGFPLPAWVLFAQPKHEGLLFMLSRTVRALRRLVLLGFGGRAQAYFQSLPGAGKVQCAWARAALQSKLWDQDLLLQQGLFPRWPGLALPLPLPSSVEQEKLRHFLQ